MADRMTFPWISLSLLEHKHPIYFQGENEEWRAKRKLANMKKWNEADQKRIKVWGKLQTFCPIMRIKHICPRPLYFWDRHLCCCRFWKRYSLGWNLSVGWTITEQFSLRFASQPDLHSTVCTGIFNLPMIVPSSSALELSF